MKTCKDCDELLGERGTNHDYCVRCISIWYSENDLDPVEIPNGDFDDEPDWRNKE